MPFKKWTLRFFSWIFAVCFVAWSLGPLVYKKVLPEFSETMLFLIVSLLSQVAYRLEETKKGT